MTHSLTKKLFLTVLAVFLFTLFVQVLFFGRHFNTVYISSIFDAQQQELSAAAERFVSGSVQERKSAVAAHSAATGSSILVLTEDYDFSDTHFFEQLGIIPLAFPDHEDIRLVAASYDTYSNVFHITQGKKLYANAIRLGSSNYYEPLILSIDGNSYTNLTGIHEYKNLYRLGEEYVDLSGAGRIAPMQTLTLGGVRSMDANRFLYARIRDCLIRRLPIIETLQDLSGHVISQNGTNYAVYYEQRTVNSEILYFITARQVIITGQEQTYINRLFYSVYLALGSILIAAAWLLSRYLSRPLIHLSEVAQKLAKLDFSQTANVRSRDEIGLLAENINNMASSLSQALEDLKTAGETARSNEVRMQRLLTDLAHEFKTPLFVISSYSEALELGIAGEDAKKYYSYISDEVDKLSGLVTEVIELSHIQMGSWKVVIEDWSIRDVIEVSIEKFTPRFRSEGFQVSWSADDVSVRMDARRIEQVLSNLLSNALKYAGPEKRIVLETRTKGDRLLVLVGNSGSLSDADRERIWERYYKGGNTSLQRLPSDGIGLDIVKTTLEAHDSTYGVEQKDGMVWFYFTLELSGEDSVENE